MNTAIMKSPPHHSENDIQGILLVDKPVGCTSFSLVSILRRILNVKKIGHAGTLDPFATGVMVMLIGRNYTRASDSLLGQDKEYIAEAHLGVATDTYDLEGKVEFESPLIPSLEQIHTALETFQGEVEQIPPMYSAKKVGGKKLYELARKGVVIDRAPVKVKIDTTLISYAYPKLTFKIACSKGTYIRSIAHELGQLLHCGAHLTQLRRTRSGTYSILECLDGSSLNREMDPQILKSRLLTLQNG